MKKQQLIKYNGMPTDLFLIFIIDQIERSNFIKYKKTKRELSSICIELVNNIITHSKKNAFFELSIDKTADKITIETKNFCSATNYSSALKKLNEIKASNDLPLMIKKSLLKSTTEKSSHLGLIKIFQKTEGNFKINNSATDKYKKFNTKCTIYDNN